MPQTYDLHITVAPNTEDVAELVNFPRPWTVLNIRNAQGNPHLIVSQKYAGNRPHEMLASMVCFLKRRRIPVLREKIERHFTEHEHLSDMFAEDIVEVHYKCRCRGEYEPTPDEVAECTKKRIAFSYNRGTGRNIVSVRFKNLAAYRAGREREPLPPCLVSEEREIVVYDSDNTLDDFWPLRTKHDPPFLFADLPHFIRRVLPAQSAA